MTKTFKGLIFIFCIFFSKVAISQEKIYYIDMDFIMNNSLAGKSIIKQLDAKNKSLASSFKKTEADLKGEETKLVSQKNILEKKDFESKVNLFQKKVIAYKDKRNETLKNFSIKKNNAQKVLIEKLMPILINYSKENSISFILPKRSIILGKSELDLTQKIIIILNKEIKSIKLN
jgi:Skp family chaperone for outer membrane proteins